MKKRGRPVLAAQSLDQALHYVYKDIDKAPKRPRNEIERNVMRKPKGRKAQPQSRTQQAALYASWLIQTEKVNPTNAARQAADRFDVNPDNVRKYLRRLLQGPQTTIDIKVNAMFSQLAKPESVRVPMVVDLSEVNAAFEAVGIAPLKTN